MLKTIADFFLGIVDVITALIDFVVGLIQDIAYVVKLTGSFVIKIPLYFGWLPSAVVSIIVTIFAIVVIYKILGREG